MSKMNFLATSSSKTLNDIIRVIKPLDSRVDLPKFQNNGI